MGLPLGPPLVSGDWGVRTCLHLVLQADSQRGGVAPTVSTAGFPDSTVRVSHDRVRAAIRNAGFAIASRGPGMSGSTS
jgi:hypothetical protein